MKRLAILIAAAALSLGLAGAASAQTTWVVNDDAAGNLDEAPPCDVAPDATTIQGGIDAAGAGDTVKVCPGSYTEDLSITTSALDLAGSGSNVTTVVGVKTYDTAEFPDCSLPNVNLQASGVSIHGFTFEHPVVTSTDYSCGIVLTGKNITIERNAFKVGAGDVSQGIQTWRETNAPEGLRDISGLTIVHNTFSELEVVEGGLGYEGIYINPQSDEEDPFNPVAINNNAFSGDLIRAVTVQDRGHTAVNNNAISTSHGPEFGDAFPRGVQLSGAEGVSVAHNLIETSGGFLGSGVAVTSAGASNSVVNNLIKDAATGVSVDGDANNVVNNKITCADEGTGVWIVAGLQNKVVANRFTNCGATSIVDDGTGTKIRANK